MSEITKVDKNFQVDSEIDKTGYRFYSVDEEPFKIYGVFREGDRYYRIPTSVSRSVSEGVDTLNKHTTGGRVRFVTDSQRFAIKVKLINPDPGPNMSRMGCAGLDLYDGKTYAGSFVPPTNMPNSAYEARKTVEPSKERLVTVNLPIYCGVKELYIGLDEGATLKPAPDYTYEKPVVFYGSSITHGGCASRPGATYEAWISRALDTNFINLGFSGNAKAEDAIAEYIAGLDMSVFVYDYDHNAKDADYLRKTHERMFLTVREKNPDLPIIIISAPVTEAPCAGLNRWFDGRREVIRETYERAIARGDKNVYYIPGNSFFDAVGNEFTCDHCHPTDLGFYFMAEKITPVIREILEK